MGEISGDLCASALLTNREGFYFVRSLRLRGLPFFIMTSFGEYISFWSVTDVLVNKRVQLCEKRHKKHQLHLLSPEMEIGASSAAEQKILEMMPPRRSWVSLSQTTRYRDLDDGHRQRYAAAVCNRKCIHWTIKRDVASGNKPPYLERLMEFVDKIRVRVLEKDFAFSAPELFPEEKDKESCRPLCKFENLEDAVILILANKYLTRLFNGLFYEESLAFRSKRDYHGEKDCVTAHHHAIVRMKEYMARNDGKKLYVGECDLQKFYDTVNRGVVRQCYYGLLQKAAKENPGVSFEEINRVFEAYLRCYSFSKIVLCKNDKEKNREFWDKNKIEEGKRCFKWVKPELLGLMKRGQMRASVGVPQGGALSGLIANMVLNTVDWQVKNKMKGNDLYLRYCDDMIIVSTSKARCRRLFYTYYNGAKRLRLAPHEPEKELKFGTKEFWNGKSKDVYLWELGRRDAAEWIGFVGYEMRRDGMMRIRKKSLQKELKKQTSVVFEKTLDKIKGRKRVSNDSLLGTLESKLISMSVGKIAVWNAPYIESEMCWSAGFKELELNPVLKKQLKELDRHRWMMLVAARRRLGKEREEKERVNRKDLEQLKENKQPDARGMVYSYYYQFARKK